MRKLLLFPFTFGLFSTQLLSQNQVLTIEDCFNPKFSPSGLRGVQWIPNSNRFTQIKGKALLSTDPGTLISDTLFTLESLATLANMEGGEVKSLPAVTWKSEKECWFVNKGKLFIYNAADKTLIAKRKFIENYDAIEISENSLNVALIEKDNISIVTASGPRRITEDGGNGIVYGQSVHRNEFGINKGFFWNSEGNKLAFYRMDETRVTQYSLTNIADGPAKNNYIRYPMAGDSSHSVKVGIYNCLTEETIYLSTDGPYDQYLTNIAWSPDGQFIYLAWVNREQNHMQLRKYRVNDGKLDKVVYEEKNEKYVEPEHPPIFIPGEDNKWLWMSEKSGYNHLYLMDDQHPPIQLTKGNWAVTDFLGFTKDHQGFYYESTQESPLQRHVYLFKFRDRNPKPVKITKGIGTHKLVINTHAGTYLDVYTSTLIPRRYSVHQLDGTQINIIHEGPNPLSGYQIGDIRIEPVLLDNNTALYGRLFLPPDFDPKKKYPLLVYVYGGPHAQMVTESWLGGGSLWMAYLAQKGTIVYTVDNRGSSNRGFEFESVTHRNLGSVEMSDQLFALKQLVKRGFIDTNRMAVHGWSFGGFMTTSLMTRAPGTFKLGVAGGPVIDWKYYEIMYTERYMDKPSENPEGYKKANLLGYVDQLKGKLMLIHGMDDDVVVPQHSYMYLQEAVKQMNTHVDFYLYPGHKHNVVGPDRAHLYKKITNYILENL
jgi:dipeptidyl-peptidase-4